MPSRLKISTYDLDKLTPSRLEGVSWIDRADPENWTEAHMVRLKEIVNQRGLHRPLDAEALQQKLGNILSKFDVQSSPNISSSRTSTPTPSRTPSPDPESRTIRAESRRQIEKWYHDLIKMGGRPAYPLELSFAQPDDYGGYADIIEYLGTATGFLKQKSSWIEFRRFQRRNRRTEEIFAQYHEDVREYRRNEAIEGDIHLLFDATQQTKVDEWKEYHYFEHRKLAGMRAKAEEGRRERELEMKEWEAAHGTGPNIDPNLPSDITWVYRSGAESDLDHFTVLLNWIEQQLGEIDQECAMSDGDVLPNAPIPLGLVKASDTKSMPEHIASTSFSTRKRMKSNRRPTNKRKKSTTSVLGPVGAPGITKTSRGTKSSLPNQRHLDDALVSGTSPTPLRHVNARRVTRAQTRTATSPINPLIQNFAKSPSEPVPLRRSQRIRDLKNKRNEQIEMIEREARQAISNAKSRRKPKQRVSTNRKLSPQAMSQGIVKCRVARKRNCSQSAKQFSK